MKIMRILPPLLALISLTFGASCFYARRRQQADHHEREKEQDDENHHEDDQKGRQQNLRAIQQYRTMMCSTSLECGDNSCCALVQDQYGVRYYACTSTDWFGGWFDPNYCIGDECHSSDQCATGCCAVMVHPAYYWQHYFGCTANYGGYDALYCTGGQAAAGGGGNNGDSGSTGTGPPSPEVEDDDDDNTSTTNGGGRSTTTTFPPETSYDDSSSGGGLSKPVLIGGVFGVVSATLGGIFVFRTSIARMGVCCQVNIGR